MRTFAILLALLLLSACAQETIIQEHTDINDTVEAPDWIVEEERKPSCKETIRESEEYYNYTLLDEYEVDEAEGIYWGGCPECSGQNPPRSQDRGKTAAAARVLSTRGGSDTQ